MRDSQYKSCAVQNQFTAYLIAAIRNYKRTYLRRISTALRTELPMEGHSEVMELCEETDFFCGLPLMQRLENERLFAATCACRWHGRCHSRCRENVPSKTKKSTAHCSAA